MSIQSSKVFLLFSRRCSNRSLTSIKSENLFALSNLMVNMIIIYDVSFPSNCNFIHQMLTDTYIYPAKTNIKLDSVAEHFFFRFWQSQSMFDMNIFLKYFFPYIVNCEHWTFDVCMCTGVMRSKQPKITRDHKINESWKIRNMRHVNILLQNQSI